MDQPGPGAGPPRERRGFPGGARGCAVQRGRAPPPRRRGLRGEASPSPRPRAGSRGAEPAGGHVERRARRGCPGARPCPRGCGWVPCPRGSLAGGSTGPPAVLCAGGSEQPPQRALSPRPTCTTWAPAPSAAGCRDTRTRSPRRPSARPPRRYRPPVGPAAVGSRASGSVGPPETLRGGPEGLAPPRGCRPRAAGAVGALRAGSGQDTRGTSVGRTENPREDNWERGAPVWRSVHHRRTDEGTGRGADGPGARAASCQAPRRVPAGGRGPTARGLGRSLRPVGPAARSCWV